MTKHAVMFNRILGCFIVPLVLLLRTARVEASPVPSHASPREAQVQRFSVIDYFYLLPSLGIGGHTPILEKRQLLRPENHPIIDVRHDYLLVHPDSSPAEQIVIFRSRNKTDLIADSMPDFESDYNAFTLFRLQDGRLRDVTSQMLPMPPDTNHLLYELPRFGSTIRVFRFNFVNRSRRHAFDLRWRGGRFVKV